MPSEAWSECSLSHGITVFTFLGLLRLRPNWWPESFKIDSCGCLREQKDWRRGVQKTYKQMSRPKYEHLSQICSKGRVPESYVFIVFRVPTPGWSPMRPQTGSKVQKHIKMEALRWIGWYLIISISYSLETLWRCFVYSMNNILKRWKGQCSAFEQEQCLVFEQRQHLSLSAASYRILSYRFKSADVVCISYHSLL